MKAGKVVETDESGKSVHLEFTSFGLSGVESVCERTSESEIEALPQLRNLKIWQNDLLQQDFCLF